MSAPLSPDTTKTSQASIAARAQALLSRSLQPAIASPEPVDATDSTPPESAPVTPLAPLAPPESIEERVVAPAHTPTPSASDDPWDVFLSAALHFAGDTTLTHAEAFAAWQAVDNTVSHTTVTAAGYVRHRHDGSTTVLPHGFLRDVEAQDTQAVPAPSAPTAPTEARGCVCCGFAGCELCGRLRRVSERLYCHCGSRAPVTEHDADCPVHPSRIPGVPLPRYRTETRHEKVGEEPYQFRLPDGSFEERKKNLWREVQHQVRVEEDAYWAEWERARRTKEQEEKAAERAKNAPSETAEAPSTRPQLSLVKQASAAPVRSASTPSSTDEAPPMEVIVLDTETTGIGPTVRLVELAAVRVRLSDWAVVGEFVRLINPTVPIPPAASNVHRIYDRDVANAPFAPEVLAEFLAFTLSSGVSGAGGSCPWVAHNAAFDGPRIAYELSLASRAGHDLGWPRQQLWCTLKMARALWPRGPGLLEMPDHKLGTLVQRLRIQARPTHRALADVYSTIGLLREGMKLKPGVGLKALCGDGVWL